MSLSTLACVLSEDGKLWMAEGRSELELHLKVDGKKETARPCGPLNELIVLQRGHF